MAIRTANKRAYLYGEGEKRKEWGLSLVVVNSRQGGCHLCKDYIGKVFIDDVYSGGKKSDGNYPLLSEAIQHGLFHPNCKDSTSTYIEGITTLEPLSSDELKELDRRRKLEAQKNYYDNQAEKSERISKYSLDEENKRVYKKRADICKNKADEIGEKIAESLEKSDGSGIINMKISSGKVVNPMPREKYVRMKHNLMNNGIIVMQAEGDDLRYLQAINAEASYGHGYILHIGKIPSASGMFEEIIHSTQAKIYGEFDSTDLIELYAREIAANRMLLRNAKSYGFDETDIEDISANLKMWEERFIREVGVGYDESGRFREIYHKKR